MGVLVVDCACTALNERQAFPPIDQYCRLHMRLFRRFAVIWVASVQLCLSVPARVYATQHVFQSEIILKPKTSSDVVVHDFQRREVDRDAYHIFNSVHNLLRQWGNTIHPNGFSFVRGTIPVGTNLYHARGVSLLYDHAIDPLCARACQTKTLFELLPCTDLCVANCC